MDPEKEFEHTVLDGSEAAISAVKDLVAWVGASEALPRELKISIGYKARGYLLALKGDYDATIQVFKETGMDAFEAEMETIDYLLAREPEIALEAAQQVLSRHGQSRGWV